MPCRFAILTPVLDDWESFSFLLQDIARTLDGHDVAIDVIAVDDGSVQQPDPTQALEESSCIASVTIIRLALNLATSARLQLACRRWRTGKIWTASSSWTAMARIVPSTSST